MNVSLAAPEVAPLFIHDCPNCLFVGHFTDYSGGMIGDGYVCPSPLWGTSVIWRTADDGWEYHSMPLSSVERMLAAGDPYVLTEVLSAWRAAP